MSGNLLGLGNIMIETIEEGSKSISCEEIDFVSIRFQIKRLKAQAWDPIQRRSRFRLMSVATLTGVVSSLGQARDPFTKANRERFLILRPLKE